MTPQRYISYVINYANIAKNYIHEQSLDAQTITVTLNQITTTALVVIDRINKGELTDYTELVEACSPIGDALFDQLNNDKDYTDYMNEQDAKQRDAHELPY